ESETAQYIKRHAMKRCDQLADLYVLDDSVNGNNRLHYSSTPIANKSSKSHSKSKRSIIPYVPKPVSKNCNKPIPEYVPGRASSNESMEANQADFDDNDTFTLPGWL